jgi:fermentation-respiration switch protein FrsA (DUF1100 family)
MKVFGVIVLIIFSSLYLLVRYLEKHSIFYPSSFIEVKPDRMGLPYEDLMITTEDGVRINGWLIKTAKAKSTLLFFHGNAGNIGDRLTKLRFFHDAGIQVLIVDYRGYGKSEGVPTEQGVYKDGRAAFDYLKDRADLKGIPVVVYGGSLGGAVAVDLATHRPVEGLIIDSSFPSAPAMSRLMYPMIPTFFLAVKFDSLHKVKDLTMPKLFMHSKDDRVIPLRLGHQLFDAAPQPKEFVELVGGHNDAHIECKELFLGSIQSFLKKNNWL